MYARVINRQGRDGAAVVCLERAQPQSLRVALGDPPAPAPATGGGVGVAAAAAIDNGRGGGGGGGNDGDDEVGYGGFGGREGERQEGGAVQPAYGGVLFCFVSFVVCVVGVSLWKKRRGGIRTDGRQGGGGCFTHACMSHNKNASRIKTGTNGTKRPTKKKASKCPPGSPSRPPPPTANQLKTSNERPRTHNNEEKIET